jgi:murein DD-endopeptidase MepM/ murein hydrolase activator NlpD
MMFRAQDKWWGNRGKRETAHEEIDLCLYKDRQDRIHRFKENTKIPAVYAGKVVGILDDFLGKSVIIEHAFPQNSETIFCTILGHTKPHNDLYTGRIVKEGDIIATLADTRRSKSGIIPHLHISIAWTSGTISFDKLDWESIGASKAVALFDPVQIIDGHYSVVERDLPL